MSGRVLVVDDVRAMAEQYAYDLRRLGGWHARIADGGAEALEALAADEVDCVILDLEMPGIDGFEVLRQMGRRGFDVPVVVYTGTGNYDRCVQAVRLGAWSFIDKAEPMQRVVQVVRNAIEHGHLVAEVRSLRARVDADTAMIGASSAMRRLHDEIRRLAPIPSPVLVIGESGTGKELVARDLHAFGPGEKAPFVAVNCAALPENLVESELFGHERGAFTGADRARRGAFELAGNGTLFLDEIGELPLPAQAKLLRALEAREITRVGGEQTIPVSARVVTATHRDLDDDVARGRFRQDLLFRLNVHVLRVPPLRDRKADIPPLVDHFLDSLSARFGMKRPAINDAVVQRLADADWRRNNVRELRNAVERLIIAAGDDDIRLEHLPADLRDDDPDTDDDRSLAALRAAAERRIVTEALDRHDWHITRTAGSLGLADHASLLKVMRRLGIRRDD